MLARCPARDDLAAWSIGRLGEPAGEEIAEHVDSCPDCLDALLQFEHLSDTVVEEVRRPDRPDPVCDEPECGRLVARIRALVGEPTADLGEPRSTEPVVDGGRIGPYLVLEPIGRGGMGIVYRARHTLLNRVVALKTLPAERNGHDPDRARFLREMGAVGSLHHPNIVQATDAGFSEGVYYLAMELVDGVDLARLVGRRGPLPVADACEVIRQSALAIDHAAGRGLVHRDVKPSNLMLARDGSVKLLDLGLARLRGGPLAEDLTHPGQVMGTAAYMAPEQASDPHSVDVRADLYSLGCTLYHLIAGRPPFGGDSPPTPLRTLLAHSRDEPPPIRERRPEVPEGLAAILGRLLAKDPADRFPTASALADALAPFCSGSRLPALFEPATEPEAPASPRPQPAPPGRRGWRPRAGLAATALAGLLAIGGGLLAPQVIIRMRDKDGKETTISAENAKTIIVEDRGKTVAEIPVGGQPASPPAAAPSRPSPPASPTASPTASRGEPLSAVALVRRPAPLPGILGWTIETRHHRGLANAIAHDPKGRWVALGGADGAIRLFDAAKGTLSRVILGHDGVVTALAWHPEGRILASTSRDKTVRLWDPDTARPLQVLRGHQEPYWRAVYGLAWSRDGEMLASSGFGDATRLWEPKSGRCLQELPPSTSCTWAPDGPRLAMTSDGRPVLIRDVTGATADVTIDESKAGGVGEISCIAWAPDGRTLAVGNAPANRVSLWDTKTGALVRTFDGCEYVSCLAWSPDGASFATSEIFDVKIREAATGRPVHKLYHGAQSPIYGLSWSPDGKTIAGSSQHGLNPARAWDAATGRLIWEDVTLSGVGGVFFSNLEWSPDGKTLASLMPDGMKCWDASDGRWRRTLRFNDDYLQRSRFSPDGRLVALASNSQLRIEESETGRVVHQIENKGRTSSVAWSPDGSRLAVGREKSARILDLDGGLAPLEIPFKEGAVGNLAWSPDGKRVAAQGEWHVRIFEAATGKPIATLGRADDGGLWGWFSALLWWPDGRTIATADQAGMLRVWDPDTGEIRRPARLAHPRGISNLQWSTDGKAILSGSGADRELIAWDPETLKPLRRVPDSGDVVSPDGKTIAGANAGAVFLADFETGRPLGTIVPLTGSQNLVVGADGNYDAAPGVEPQIVYVVRTGEGQETLTPHEFAARYGRENAPGAVRLVR